MNSRQTIKNTIDTADMVCGSYLGDLTDEEMMKRPHAGCNHINWQVGHLIAADNMMANGCFPDTVPALPEGFSEKYGKETASNDDAAAFCNKDELMGLLKAQREAIFAKLEVLNDEDLDAPAPESMQGYAPTAGAALNMIGSHWLMHAGQWVVLRRELGREIVI
jgi:hypothetical protein